MYTSVINEATWTISSGRSFLGDDLVSTVNLESQASTLSGQSDNFWIPTEVERPERSDPWSVVHMGWAIGFRAGQPTSLGFGPFWCVFGPLASTVSDCGVFQER